MHPRIRAHKNTLKHMALALVAMAVVWGLAFTFIGFVWGFERLWDDFIPLDNSSIGPNLCASIFLVILMAGLNEFKLVERDLAEGKTLLQVLEDTVEEAVSPIETAEGHIADDVVEKMEKD